MPAEIVVSEMMPGQEEQVIALVQRAFDLSVAAAYTAQGVQEFKAYASAPALSLRVQEGVSFVLVAFVDGIMAGMIEVRHSNHVALLFTEPAYQRRGLARSLVEAALERCLRFFPDLHEVTVNSSPNALRAYECLGFHPSAPEQEKNGIKFTPMVYKLTG